MNPATTNSSFERELFLRSLGMGRPTGDAAVFLGQHLTALRVRAGKTIYGLGEAPDAIYYVVSGQVEQRAPHSAPWSFGPGATLGVHDLFLDRPRLRTAVAMDDVELLRVRCDDYLELLEDNREFTRALIGTVGAGLATMGASAQRMAVHPPGQSLPLLDRVMLLRTCEAFRRARVQTLFDFADLLREVGLRRGETLAVGHGVDVLSLVASGALQVDEADRRPPARFVASTIVGGYESFGGRDDTGRAVCVEDATLMQFDRDGLLAVIDDHFDLARSLLAGIALERERSRDAGSRPGAARRSARP